jgi:hypothetical protein
MISHDKHYMKIDESTNFNAFKNSLCMLTIKNTINKHKLKKSNIIYTNVG